MRLIDENGKMVGIVNREEALTRAQEVGIDLVEIAPEANPPVVKIIEFSKLKYEERKKEREAKKKLKEVEVKEIRLGPFMGEHDFWVRIRRIEGFLAERNKVKVAVDFPGRKISHSEFGYKLLSKLTETLKGKITIEREPKFEGRRLYIIIGPAQGAPKTNGKDENKKGSK